MEDSTISILFLIVFFLVVFGVSKISKIPFKYKPKDPKKHYLQRKTTK
jgi:archaellum biogenesis protein FlaJ (TadC family)